MWELDYKKRWAQKNWCFWTVVLDKTLESPLDCKEIQGVHPKGNQSWIFIGRTDAEAETPVLWPPNMKSWLIWKDPDAGKDWGQEKKGTTEVEMVGWHHCLNGHGFGWTPGVGDGQRGLVCCDSWGRKELDTTERLNWTEARYRCGFSKSIYSLPVSVWHLSHYLVNCHNISKILVFIICLWWSVISDLCCHCSNCFEMSWSSSKYDGELHLRMLCSNCLSEWPSSISLPVLRPPYSLKCNSTEIRPIN